MNATVTETGPDGIAIFSDDYKYRYYLSRTWDDRPTVVFVMLNPSTADAFTLDPTVRRCVNYAKDWGYGGLAVLNIFALRSTDPKALRQADDPIGKVNDAIINAVTGVAPICVAAWGAHGAYMNRGAEVLNKWRDRPWRYLATTKDGYPRHPLYLKKSLRPLAFAKNV